MSARFCMRVLCAFAGAMLAARAYAALDIDGERIMEVLLEDGGQLSSALIVYPSAQDWYFPLAETTEALGLAIRVSAVLGKASGFVIEEGRQFELDVHRCTVRWSGGSGTYPCEQVQVYQDDIFVHQDLFQRWFPVRFQLNLYKSQVIVSAREKLPVQLRRERERLAERSKGLISGYDPGFPQQEIPAKIFAPPIIDDQLALSHSTNSGASKLSMSNTIQASGELVGLQAYALVTHSERQIQTSRFTLSKRSPDATLFGPLGAREVTALDIVTPLMPMITNGVSGKGFAVSSYPINQPYAFDKHDFQGPLPSGWEVLLYRNDVLVERQLSDGSGIYFFRNVALFYGLNRFRFTFFGPYGQRRDEYKTINLSPDMIQPGKGYYRISYLELEGTHQRATAQYSRNFSRHITGNAAVLHDTAGQTYGSVGVTGMNERFLFLTNCVLNNRNGKACEWGGQFGIEWLTVGAKHTRLFDFQSDIFNRSSGPVQTGETTLNVSYLLPTIPNVSTTLEAVHRNFRDAPDSSSFRHLIGFTSGKFFWNHRLNIECNGATRYTGRWDLSYVPSLTRFNFGLDYEPTKLLSADFEMQANFMNRYLLNLLLSRRLRESTTNALFTASRMFGHFALGATFATTDLRDISFGLLFTIGLVPDPEDYTLSSFYRPVGQYGMATVRVFKDLNYNGIFDPGEPPMPEIQVLVNQRDWEKLSGEDGKILVTYLQPYAPVDVAISLAALKDPFLRPGKKGVRFVSRAGKVAVIDMPLQVAGQVDGNVESVVNGAHRGRRRIEMELRSVSGSWSATAKTDRDGYFQFEEVPPGEYRLRPKDLPSVPAEQTIVMPAEGSFESAGVFEVPPSTQ